MVDRIDWNDANIALLKKLWDEGLTCQQIAERMGAPSRSSIIGKVHRLGLPRRVSNGVPRAPTHRAKPLRETRGISLAPIRKLPPVNRKVKPMLVVLSVPDPSGAVPIWEVTGCKWPVDERDGRHLFCNHGLEGHHCYCPFHRRAATERPVKRKEAA